jgi:hypothetical protein
VFELGHWIGLLSIMVGRWWGAHPRTNRRYVAPTVVSMNNLTELERKPAPRKKLRRPKGGYRRRCEQCPQSLVTTLAYTTITAKSFWDALRDAADYSEATQGRAATAALVSRR